ncbi:MAG: histidine phosphatase family protein [Thauera sp.]
MKSTPLTAATCRICLVRHGETAWNVERRLQGHLDIPLNTVGQRQAEAAAANLERTPFAAFYSSDLTRTRETAATVARPHGLAVRPEPRLRERHYGAFQGLTYAEAARLHPDTYRLFVARDTDFSFPGGGESLNTFAARVRAALEDIAARHRGEQVLVVTHGGVLDVVHRIASSTDLRAPRDFALPNAALNWIEHTAGAWRMLRWADQTHLGEARDELPNA